MSTVTRRPTTLSDRALISLAVACFVLGMVMHAFDLPYWVYNTVRAVILIESVFIFVAAVAIVRVYYKNFRVAPDQARLLPRHVIQLGVMVMGITFAITFQTIKYVDTNPVWWGIPFVLPALTVGAFGLTDMLRWLPHRRADIKPSGVQPVGLASNDEWRAKNQEYDS